MTLRVLFVSEGSSDRGLRPHIEQAAAEEGQQILLTAPDFALLAGRVGHAVGDKLRAARQLGGDFDVVIVQRDADGQGVQARREEIAAAVEEVWGSLRHVPVIPVRMLEAWLLVDESVIRQVAGNPGGKTRLGLPKGPAVERVPDPKSMLKDALATASELKGRRLEIFQKRFPQNRHRLLELIDPSGPLRDIPSWRAFVVGLSSAFRSAGTDGTGIES
ncbi:DUF4276 family protein [Streptomyces sp. B1866]|uniref:DUF4276 family protein n=1 Tax=Streptomyces sp. B1866 TaxID=3075431 RepID=UPI00289189A1|nr:DUF4276 family protein [Streptomyces sp. B1866]MDT3396494.1 DUF4276 family protein [Streptomyces sp. B1866]